MAKQNYKKGYLIHKYNNKEDQKEPLISTLSVETNNLEEAVNEFVDKNTYNVSIRVTREYAEDLKEKDNIS